MANDGAADRAAIRDLIDAWVICRDSGYWDQFAALWWPDGRMYATWFQASAADFVERSRRAWLDGMTVIHSLGGTMIDLAGDRAVAQTRMQITQRGMIGDVAVDVVCQGRFLDALERREGRWGLLQRRPIYELDRISPVDPSAALSLDPERLASFPAGYRHLAYLQSSMGFAVSRSLPGTRGEAVERLLSQSRRWLDGGEAIDMEAD